MPCLLQVPEFETPWPVLQQVLETLGSLVAAQDQQALAAAANDLPLTIMADVVLYNCWATEEVAPSSQAAQPGNTVLQAPVKPWKRRRMHVTEEQMHERRERRALTPACPRPKRARTDSG